ncbi:MAG: hypothetical protein AAGL49_03855 [Pseudomonadota bacterium]
MIEPNFALASTLLFDPRVEHTGPMRGALYEMGLRDVDIVSDLDTARQYLSDRVYDLFVGEVAQEGDPLVEFVSGLRHADFGLNPFVGVIATTWRLNARVVREIVDAGVDDILGRPFSYRAVALRLNAIVEARKPFVVTADYIGPDRRFSRRPPNADIRMFDAPNLLRAKYLDDACGVRAEEARVEAVRALILQEKMRRLAERIAALAVMLERRLDQGAADARFVMSDDPGVMLDDLEPKVALLKRMASTAGSASALALSEQMGALARRLANAEPAEAAADLIALREMAEAVDVALDPQAAPDAFAQRITTVIASLERRRAQIAAA